MTEWEKNNGVMVASRCFRYLEALELAEDVFCDNKEKIPEFEQAEKACEKAKVLIQKRVKEVMGW